MLVLSRKVGEEIVIDDQVRVRIASIQGKRVRLAISAPEDISIFRSEVRSQQREFAAESELLLLIGD